MSYRRAWLLVDTMNGCFRGPVVASARGGAGGGGAQLTPLGVEVLARYRDMEAKALESLDEDLATFTKLMRYITPSGALIGDEESGVGVLEQVTDEATVALCAEMLGGMSAAFDMTLTQLKERDQFGTKIGTFQGLKHRAARVYMELELARSTVMAAARAVDAGEPEAARRKRTTFAARESLKR